jgi:hypothetical protein
MPTCKLCDIRFNNLLRVEGKIVNCKNRKYCLECSPYGKHNTKKLEKYVNGASEKIPPLACVCIKCNKDYFYVRQNGTTKNLCSNCISNKRRKTAKEKSVEHMGGKCQICGYDKCLRSLHFHHKDGEEKKFELCYGARFTWQEVLEEINKCILVCANCHGEIHSGMHKDFK